MNWYDLVSQVRGFVDEVEQGNNSKFTIREINQKGVHLMDFTLVEPIGENGIHLGYNFGAGVTVTLRANFTPAHEISHVRVLLDTMLKCSPSMEDSSKALALIKTGALVEEACYEQLLQATLFCSPQRAGEKGEVVPHQPYCASKDGDALAVEPYMVSNILSGLYRAAFSFSALKQALHAS